MCVWKRKQASCVVGSVNIFLKLWGGLNVWQHLPLSQAQLDLALTRCLGLNYSPVSCISSWSFLSEWSWSDREHVVKKKDIQSLLSLPISSEDHQRTTYDQQSLAAGRIHWLISFKHSSIIQWQENTVVDIIIVHHSYDYLRSYEREYVVRRLYKWCMQMVAEKKSHSLLPPSSIYAMLGWEVAENKCVLSASSYL